MVVQGLLLACQERGSATPPIGKLDLIRVECPKYGRGAPQVPVILQAPGQDSKTNLRASVTRADQ
jgi:hypothetical protein